MQSIMLHGVKSVTIGEWRSGWANHGLYFARSISIQTDSGEVNLTLFASGEVISQQASQEVQSCSA